MLVIRRRAAESFLIGDHVEVEVLGIDGAQVKLGIRAPREVVVLRKEVYALRDINRNSAQTRLPDRLNDLVTRLSK
jgi:carbon storage regulator